MKQVHLQVIRTADDDGSNSATITATEVATLVDTANAIYAPADVQFVYDPAKDFTHINSTLLNQDFTALELLEKATDMNKTPATSAVPHTRARRQLTELFNDRIVVFFSKRSKLSFNTSQGHWVIVGGSYHSSAGIGVCVNMLSTAGGNVLAHELGHFLQNRHTFSGSTPTTIDAAAQTIRAFVDGGQAKGNGANVFDGDAVWVTDTPPDPGPGLFATVHGAACSTESAVAVPVTFADATTQTYQLAPDRTDVMSYFRCTNLGTPVRLTPQQAWRLRDALETGLRNRLITPSGAKISGSLTRRGDSTAAPALTALTRIAIVAVGGGKVVTVLNNSGNLKLIAWDLGTDGANVQVRGSNDAGAVKEIAACYAGLGLVATAVQTSSGFLKLILWKVDDQGNITRAGDQTSEAIGSVIAISRVGLETLATAVTTSSGSLKVITWNVTAAGKIASSGSASAGGVSRIAVAESWNLSITDDGEDTINYGQLTTAVRDNSGNLKLIQWGVENGGKKIVRMADAAAGAVDDIALCALPPRTLVSAVRDASGDLKLIAWMLNDEGLAITRWDSTGAGKVSEIAMCPIGVDLVATAVRNDAGSLKIIVWRLLANGAEIVRVAEWTAGAASQITVCQVAPGLLATAVKDGNGNLKVIAWKLQ